MVLKIDRSSDGKSLILRLSGRIQSEHLQQLKVQMEGSPQVALDLQDVKLVDRGCGALPGELRGKWH